MPTVFIPAGQLSVTLVLNPINDDLVESDEVVITLLPDVENYNLAIAEDDTVARNSIRSEDGVQVC